MTTDLLITDVQNNHLAKGAFPLWNAKATLDAIYQACSRHEPAPQTPACSNGARTMPVSMSASWPPLPVRPS
nr:hypothetical protein [uncultured Pseudoxanthomonas sp.]